MGVDWDLHLLSPLHGVFGDEHEYRPRNGTPFTINGIFDRGYAQVAENLDGESEINTSSPMLGVRDAEFRKLGKSQPAVSDRVFIKTVGGHIINQLFVVSNVEPDSHGGSRLVLNVVNRDECSSDTANGCHCTNRDNQRGRPRILTARLVNFT